MSRENTPSTRKSSPPHGTFALNRYKSTFLIAAAVLLLCGAVFVWGVAGEDTQTHDGITFTAWNTANSLPAEGDYYLNTDVTLSNTWEIKDNKTVNLCLNGHVIKLELADDKTGSVIKIESGAKLNLYDCGTKPHYFTFVDNGPWTYEGTTAPVGKEVVDLANFDRATATGKIIAVTGGCITGGRGLVVVNITAAAVCMSIAARSR